MSIWTTLFSGQTVLSGVIGVVASVGAFTYQYNQDSFEAAVSEASAVTALREQLVSQQRQLDAAERRHAASVLDVKKEQEKLRLEALVQGSEQNRVMMGLLEKWLDELSKRVEDLPTLVGGGIEEEADVRFMVNLFEQDGVEDEGVAFLVAEGVLDEDLIDQTSLACPTVVVSHV